MTTHNPDANDLLFGNAVPVVSFDVGTKVRFRVVSQSAIHRREVKFNSDKNRYEQGLAQYWDDGKVVNYETDRKVLDPVITIQTTWSNWEGTSEQAEKVGADDGMRRVILKGRKEPKSLMDAVKDACKAAGVRKILPGHFGEIACDGEGKPARKNMSPPKLYSAVWHTEPPAWASELPGDDTDTDDAGDDDSPFSA